MGLDFTLKFYWTNKFEPDAWEPDGMIKIKTNKNEIKGRV